MAKVRTGVTLDPTTVKTLTYIAQEQGLSTPLRVNISAAIDHVVEFYRQNRRLVDSREQYTTRQPG